MKELLLSVRQPGACLVAVVRDGSPEQVYVEQEPANSRVGNIYKGRIVNIEPSIQAAFLDYGVGRNGFLHVSDVEPGLYLNIPNPALHGHEPARPRIEAIFRRGQELLVQVIKEGIGTKGATLTTYLSLSTRSLVLMPGLSGEIGVTRKIEDEEQRQRLRLLIEQAGPPEGLGFIARQAALDRTAEQLHGEMTFLERLWRLVQRRSNQRPAPIEVYRDCDPLAQAIAATCSADIDTIWVDEQAAVEPAREMLDLVSPGAGARLRLHEGTDTLFARYGIQEETGQRPALPTGASAPDTPAGPAEGG
jgi:ribonuclease E